MILIDPQLKAEFTQTAEKPPSPRSLNRFLSQAQSAVRLKGEVNVLLTTDSNQCALNRRFRHKNKTTDVLSFPATTDADFRDNNFAGDLSISLPVARRQASEHNHSLITELKVLILHGLLHLSGHDHETDSGEMAKKEEKLRTKLNLPTGLIERVDGRPKTAKKKSVPIKIAPELSRSRAS